MIVIITFIINHFKVIHILPIVNHTLFLIASNTPILSSTMINFAYCQNKLENSTAVPHNINNQITNQLFIISNVINLSVVIRYVYGQKEKANAFSSNMVKKSQAPFHIAFDMFSFFWFKKCIIAEIPIGYRNTYHIENIRRTMMINRII